MFGQKKTVAFQGELNVLLVGLQKKTLIGRQKKSGLISGCQNRFAPSNNSIHFSGRRAKKQRKVAGEKA